MKHLRTFVPILSAAMALAACEAGIADKLDAQDDDSASTSSGAGGTSGEGGAGQGGFFTPTSGSGSGGMEECAATEQQAEPKKLHMLVVLDRSGSMSGSKWTGSIGAISSYINDPSSAGTAMGLNYFPPLDSGADQCAEGSYNPPMVAMGDLPTHGNVLTSSMNSTSVTGTTPTFGALFGSLQHATELQDQYPDDVVVVVLASDGDPTSCDTSIGSIANLAAGAYAYNGVRTFAVAIAGSDLADLATIASAGGGQAFDVTGNINLFKDKLDEIKATAIGCEYAIPEQPDGAPFDPLKVNVEYTPGVGAVQQLPVADGLSGCGSGPGWYYDDPVDPTQILLCPVSCTAVQSDTNANVSLLFGCPTIVN